jgi:hypothetical protein
MLSFKPLIYPATLICIQSNSVCTCTALAQPLGLYSFCYLDSHRKFCTLHWTSPFRPAFVQAFGPLYRIFFNGNISHICDNFPFVATVRYTAMTSLGLSSRYSMLVAFWNCPDWSLICINGYVCGTTAERLNQNATHSHCLNEEGGECFALSSVKTLATKLTPSIICPPHSRG